MKSLSVKFGDVVKCGSLVELGVFIRSYLELIEDADQRRRTYWALFYRWARFHGLRD